MEDKEKQSIDHWKIQLSCPQTKYQACEAKERPQIVQIFEQDQKLKECTFFRYLTEKNP